MVGFGRFFVRWRRPWFYESLPAVKFPIQLFGPFELSHLVPPYVDTMHILYQVGRFYRGAAVLVGGSGGPFRHGIEYAPYLALFLHGVSRIRI